MPPDEQRLCRSYHRESFEAWMNEELTFDEAVYITNRKERPKILCHPWVGFFLLTALLIHNERSSHAARRHRLHHRLPSIPILIDQRGEAPANIGQAIFTAPDADRDVFAQLAQDLRSLASRLTLYASSKDKAIRASRKLHDAPRAGEGGRRILLLAGLDSVDASAMDTSFLNHSYFAENKSVISDLYELIHAGTEPARRFCLARKVRSAKEYYVFDRCR